MIAPTEPREMTDDELHHAEELADRLFRGQDIRRPETLRAAYFLALLCSDPRLRRAS